MRLYTAVCGVACALSSLSACDDDSDVFILSVNDVTVTTAEDTPILIRLPVRKNGDVEATVTLQPMHGTLVETEPQNWMYTPEANYAGTDTIEVTFERGPRTVVGTANITITPVNDAPTAAADSFAANFGASITIAHSTLLMNDTDIDSTELSVSGVIEGEHGSALMDGDSIIFTPEANFQGAATFQYVLTDGGTTTAGTVTVTVGTNNAPVAVNDTTTVAEDATLNVAASTLVSNDTDADSQTLAIASVSNPTNGTVSLLGSNVRFVPTANFFGAATFEYSVTDGAASSTGTVTVTVTAVNDTPSASSDVATTTEDTSVEIAEATLTANDSDIDEDTLQITAVGGATNGGVSLAGGLIRFTPATNYNGLAGFDYTVTDGTAFTTAHVTVTVGPANDPPVAVDDSRGGIEDVPTVLGDLNLTMNDTDIDGDNLMITAVGNPTNGTVAVSNGTVTFTAANNFNGLASFEYTVSDGTATDTGLVTLLIAAANDGPVATNDAASTMEDTAVVISVLANDTDIDGDTLFINSVTQPGHGTATVIGNTIRYLPASNYTGADAFTYTARDAAGAQSMAQVAITVSPVNDNPTAITDVVVMDEGTTYPIAVLENDFDVDGDSVFLSTATLPLHGNYVIADGIITYTPNQGYDGMDTFDYRIIDGNGGMAQGTVTITIFPGTAVCGDGLVSGSEECDPGFNDADVVVLGKGSDGPSFQNCNPDTCRFRCATGTGAREVQLDLETANCYAHYEAPQAWTAARDTCSTLGGHLATVTTFSEELTTEYLMNGIDAWLGGSGSGSGSGAFNWVTSPDEYFDNYTDWGSGAPSATSTECVQIDSGTLSWDDRSCTETHAYVCEFEAGLWAHGSFDELAGEFQFRMESPRVSDRDTFNTGEGYAISFYRGGKIADDDIDIDSFFGDVEVYFGNDVTWGQLVTALNNWAATELLAGVAPIGTLTDPGDAALEPEFIEAHCDLFVGFEMPFFVGCYAYNDNNSP